MDNRHRNNMNDQRTPRTQQRNAANAGADRSADAQKLRRSPSRKAKNTQNAQNTHNTPNTQNTQNAPKTQKTRQKHRFRGADVRKNDFIKRPDVVRVRGGIDRPMLIIIIVLLCFGSVMVFSASYASANTLKNDSFYYIKRQIIYAVLGVAVMAMVSRIDYRAIRKIVPAAFIATCILLLCVLALGTAQGEALRWLYIGPVSFQPSEVVKPVIVLFLANFFALHQDKVTNYRDFRQSSIWGDLVPAAFLGLVCLLVALEKHLSGTIIIFMIGITVIFCGGARKFWLGAAGGAGLLGAGLIYALTPYVRHRVDIFLHPEAYSVMDDTWQTVQGLNAIGSGGFLGVGLGNSYQKFLFVSQPQNDFIFSIVCEELGFVGAITVIALFIFFIWRGFLIAMKAPDTFSSLTVIGIVAHVAIQAVLNIAVVTAVIPNTGITLPFFSCGGSALVILMAEMGIILSISRYSYKED